jgi:biotin-[acetyl-CoA-carboxylase] ligase BirA-like protein
MEKFIHVERCDSTQDLLKEQLTGLLSDEFTVSCEHQLKGKGRAEKVWEDGPGTLCFSMTLLPHKQTSFTALEISLLVSQFFQLKGQQVGLKWPNDLLSFDGKKCGGILVQNSKDRYLTGIGINLFYIGNQFGGIYPDSFKIDKKAWAQEMSHYIRSHRYESTTQLSLDWHSQCVHINCEVIISEMGTITQGLFLGLGEFGECLIENAQGIHKVFNGTLRLV